MGSLSGKRAGRADGNLRVRAEQRFVDSDEFLRLLVSSRPLDRLDDPGAGLLGLCDRATGERYWISAARMPRPARGLPRGAS